MSFLNLSFGCFRRPRDNAGKRSHAPASHVRDQFLPGARGRCPRSCGASVPADLINALGRLGADVELPTQAQPTSAGLIETDHAPESELLLVKSGAPRPSLGEKGTFGAPTVFAAGTLNAPVSQQIPTEPAVGSAEIPASSGAPASHLGQVSRPDVVTIGAAGSDERAGTYRVAETGLEPSQLGPSVFDASLRIDLSDDVAVPTRTAEPSGLVAGLIDSALIGPSQVVGSDELGNSEDVKETLLDGTAAVNARTGVDPTEPEFDSEVLPTDLKASLLKPSRLERSSPGFRSALMPPSLGILNPSASLDDSDEVPPSEAEPTLLDDFVESATFSGPKGGSPIGMIIGIVFGILALIAVLAVLFIFRHRICPAKTSDGTSRTLDDAVAFQFDDAPAALNLSTLGGELETMGLDLTNDAWSEAPHEAESDSLGQLEERPMTRPVTLNGW